MRNGHIAISTYITRVTHYMLNECETHGRHTSFVAIANYSHLWLSYCHCRQINDREAAAHCHSQPEHMNDILKWTSMCVGTRQLEEYKR